MEHEAAQESLNGYLVDFALVFSTDTVPGFDVVLTVPQRLTAIMSSVHPLARHEVLRLRDCLNWPMVLPTRSFSGRMLFERSLASKGLSVTPLLESNSFEYLKAHVARTEAITFQIAIGAPELDQSDITTCTLDHRDIWAGSLFLGQLKGRSLSVAASRFVQQISRSLSERYAE
jgi:DNA-binding transcriptional LysR family regulator